MNNNQFKKELREIVEETAAMCDLAPIYVDTKALTRMYYLFNTKGKCKATLEVNCYNEEATIYFKKGDEKLASYVWKDEEIRAKYTHFKDLIDFVNKVIESVKCKCGGKCKCTQ